MSNFNVRLRFMIDVVYNVDADNVSHAVKKATALTKAGYPSSEFIEPLGVQQLDEHFIVEEQWEGDDLRDALGKDVWLY